jgi:hypothetical protein
MILNNKCRKKRLQDWRPLSYFYEDLINGDCIVGDRVLGIGAVLK